MNRRRAAFAGSFPSFEDACLNIAGALGLTGEN
jgi:hypothetical protein